MPRLHRSKHKKIVVIGGGTGSFTLLQALKSLTPDITALVNMADDGGSSGALRDELGVLPPGDVRQCLVALARTEKLRDLFDYRFDNGSLQGHSFGNIFLTALEKWSGSFAEAVETASQILNIQGRVLPITLDNVRLVHEAGNGNRTHGEHHIDLMRFDPDDGQPNIYLDPHAVINPEAAQAIRQADYIIIAPGDIYTSLGPLLLVDGVPDALKQTRARIVYVCNLVVKPGQTTGMDVADHAAEIERFAGGRIIDIVLYNTAQPSQELLRKYVHDEEYPVAYDEDRLHHAHYRAIGGNFLAHQGGKRKAHDPLAAHRSLIRHDTDAIARAIEKIIYAPTILTKRK
jgi:uncharacterized cofD-like protein